MKKLEYIKRNFGIPKLLRFFNPNYSHCRKCGLPWNFCKLKAVNYSENSGTFATCDVCWNNSTLNELKYYYTNVYKKQKTSLYGTKHKMEHTCEHLLKCVELEYNKTHKL
jgi:hypothetical protein